MKGRVSMKNGVLFFLAIFLTCFLWGKNTASGFRRNDTLTIGFWNVENLFDLVDDLEKNDDEFSLGGKKNVTQEIYNLKLKNCAEVLSDLNADIVGICEVENRFMMEELNKAYSSRDYSIIHYDSPDRRGIDCALFYDTEKFKVLESKPIKNVLSTGTATRDILYVKGKYQDEVLHLFVNHWPSSYGGKAQAMPKRADTSKLLEQKVLEILRRNPQAEILILGDLNEEPTEENVQNLMTIDEIKTQEGQLVNLMIPFISQKGIGTYVYRGKDNFLDQMLVSWGLTDSDGLKYLDGSMTILDLPKYRQQTGKYSHYPFRFWAGNKLLGGYSDHLAIKVSIVKTGKYHNTD